MTEDATVGKLTPDELQLLTDYRLNHDRNKIVIQIIARGLRVSGVDALGASDAEALQALRSIPA